MPRIFLWLNARLRVWHFGSSNVVLASERNATGAEYRGKIVGECRLETSSVKLVYSTVCIDAVRLELWNGDAEDDRKYGILLHLTPSYAAGLSLLGSSNWPAKRSHIIINTCQRYCYLTQRANYCPRRLEEFADPSVDRCTSRLPRP